jgi:hypothetical protein
VVASVLLKLSRLGRARASTNPPSTAAHAARRRLRAVVTLLLRPRPRTRWTARCRSSSPSRAVPDAYGRNVVNVILVDFRALDTLGEIAVVLLSLVAALPLLERARAGRRRGGAPMNPRVVMLEVFARGLYWVILAASVWVLLRGHNEPGGGFIGGLVAVSATVLWASRARPGGDAARRLPLGSPLVLAVAACCWRACRACPGSGRAAAFLTHLVGDAAARLHRTQGLHGAAVRRRRVPVRVGRARRLRARAARGRPRRSDGAVAMTWAVALAVWCQPHGRRVPDAVARPAALRARPGRARQRRQPRAVRRRPARAGDAPRGPARRDGAARGGQPACRRRWCSPPS